VLWTRRFVLKNIQARGLRLAAILRAICEVAGYQTQLEHVKDAQTAPEACERLDSKSLNHKRLSDYNANIVRKSYQSYRRRSLTKAWLRKRAVGQAARTTRQIWRRKDA
jgi:hypothetical protein